MLKNLPYDLVFFKFSPQIILAYGTYDFVNEKAKNPLGAYIIPNCYYDYLSRYFDYGFAKYIVSSYDI